jgi:hypothetical protein
LIPAASSAVFAGSGPEGSELVSGGVSCGGGVVPPVSAGGLDPPHAASAAAITAHAPSVRIEALMRRHPPTAHAAG